MNMRTRWGRWSSRHITGLCLGLHVSGDSRGEKVLTRQSLTSVSDGCPCKRQRCHRNNTLNNRIMFDWVLWLNTWCFLLIKHSIWFMMDVWEANSLPSFFTDMYEYSILICLTLLNFKFLQKSTISVGWLLGSHWHPQFWETPNLQYRYSSRANSDSSLIFRNWLLHLSNNGDADANSVGRKHFCMFRGTHWTEMAALGASWMLKIYEIAGWLQNLQHVNHLEVRL